MSTDATEWEDITPDPLRSAVGHIRNRFEEMQFSLGFQTQQICFDELHPVVAPQNPSAIFKRCMDVYALGLKSAVDNRFRDLLQIGLANAHLIKHTPVEWAESHLELLIAKKQYTIKLWIKNVCDRQEMPSSTTPADLEELAYWRRWRAPKLIHMQPSGNTPFDSATAWIREDEGLTQKLLEGFSDRFINSIVFHLERIAGEAHVQLAKEGPQIVQADQGGIMKSAFISYSWDDDVHIDWVRKLAERLRADGVNVSIDRWAAVPGDQLPVFMERAIRDNQFVVIICTPRYKQRADARHGGVGYEGDIMTAEVLSSQNQRKFIPVLRSGSWLQAAPTWLAGKYYINLSNEPYSERDYEDLVRTLLGIRETAPPIGPPMATIAAKTTTASGSSSESTDSEFEDIKITRVIVEEITQPLNDGSRGSALYSIPFALSRNPPLEWAQLFIENWNHPPSYTTMHRPGIASVYGATVILDGTTIDEVERYHRDTLQLAIAETNRRYREWRHDQEQIRSREDAQVEEHRKRIEDATKRIRFD